MPGLTSKLPEGWERSETTGGIPYYINHETERTYWDHPDMVQLLQDVAGLNNIKYAAYRTAMKLRAIQKKTQMYLLELPVVMATLEEEGIKNGFSEKTLSASDMLRIITAIFINQNADRRNFIDIPLASDLTFNWILNVFDMGRTGFVQSVSFKVGLSFMCAAKLQDKYKYIFKQLSNNKGSMDRKRLKLFLQEALQIPKNIYESAVFSGTSVEPAVTNCFERAPTSVDQLNLDEFLDWMIAEPQTIVWLPTLHRLAVSETVKHESKCNVCKLYPIVGFRYRCLKCFNFDLCQECFWSGRVNKGHKIGHPTQEYCLATSQKEDFKDFAKVMKNKVSKKKRNPADPSKGRYISIANEDEPLSSGEEYSVDAPQKNPKFNADTHDKLGSYASRLADYDEIDDKPRDLLPRHQHDLHYEPGVIHHYPAGSLSEEPTRYPETSLQLRSPSEVERVLDPNQRDELEDLIGNLEDDNRALRDEIDSIHQLQLQNLSLHSLDNSDEAERLRQRKERLLAREEVLESHNHQLQIQLNRLRSMLHQDIPKASTRPQKSAKQTSIGRSPTIPYQPSPLPKVTSSTQPNREHVPGLYRPTKESGDRTAPVITPSQATTAPPGTQACDLKTRGVTTHVNEESCSIKTQASFPTSFQTLAEQSTDFHTEATIPKSKNRGIPTTANHGVQALTSQTPAPGLQQPYTGIRGLPTPEHLYSEQSQSPLHNTAVHYNGIDHQGSAGQSYQSLPQRVMPSPLHNFGPTDKSGSSYEQAELQNIVERMASAFPLEAESDISMEIHSDLFLAAAMVSEAMQSLVTAVSRQRGQDFLDSQFVTDDEIPPAFGQNSANSRNQGIFRSTGYVEDYGPL